MGTVSPHKLSFPNPQIPSSRRSHHLRQRPSYPFLPPRFPDSAACRCCTRSDSPSQPESPGNRRWDSVLQQVFRNGFKAFDSVVNLYRKEQKTAADGTPGRAAEGRRGADEDWDWDRWKKHFEEVDEQERLVSVLKSQLGNAVCREDYEDAAMLKVAIAAAAKNDTVGRVMYNLSRAIKEERYQDAAFLRDYASAGLVGWWSGFSDDSDDPYGLIVCITAEHGRYVARSFSPRQLASAAAGVPLFEIFLTMNKKGEYKQQAVFLKQSEVTQDSPTISSRSSGVANMLNPSDLTEDNTDVLVVSHDDVEDTDDIDDGLSGFQNIVRDMNPGAMVRVSKETASGKVDRDFMSKMIEDITEDEDEDENEDEDEEEDAGVTSEGTDDELKDESDQEIDEIEINIGDGFINNEEEGELALKIVVGGLVENLSSNVSAKELLRMPANLDKKGRFSFSFSIKEGTSQQDPAAKEQASKDRKDKLQIQRIMDRVTLDIFKAAGKEKIPMKALKDIGELISLSLRQVQNRPSLSGSTTFSRIEIPSTSDPLNGLYIGARGLNASEVIHMRRKFGYWQEDGGTKDPSNLEFYEYVEALKLTGDPNVPAGQVAFRAKVGKRYQLPHKGIIPEEFGVIARYKGQGRLAEPGFKNPRWVDGELVVLDGKYIKEGPVVGFVYWAPEYHFLVFFNRLRLQD